MHSICILRIYCLCKVSRCIYLVSRDSILYIYAKMHILFILRMSRYNSQYVCNTHLDIKYCVYISKCIACTFREGHTTRHLENNYYAYISRYIYLKMHSIYISSCMVSRNIYYMHLEINT